MTKTSSLFFAAGDVGGARALRPVAQLAHDCGHAVYALAHGTLYKENLGPWQWVTTRQARNPHYWQQDKKTMIYAASVADKTAENIAYIASQAGQKIVYLLDNWGNYRERLQTDSAQTIFPNLYATMDQVAYEQAIVAGIPQDILSITGHPGLAKLARESAEFGLPQTNDELHLMFVSEPARHDSLAVHSRKREYDEEDISRLIARHLPLYSAENFPIRLHIVPHPREDRGLVWQRWQELLCRHQKTLRLELVTPDRVRQTLHLAHGVIGMSSLLLYEAWLLHKATLSIQPGLQLGLQGAFPHHLSMRRDLIFCDKAQYVARDLQNLINQARQTAKPPRQEISLHAHAAQEALDQILALGA